MTTPAHEKAVFQLVYRRSGRPVSTLSSQDRLLQDLGIDGDDAAELLLELSRAFQIDMSTLEMAKHFRSEPNLFSVLRLPGSRKKGSVAQSVGRICSKQRMLVVRAFGSAGA
jgi:acyl carrier protein